MKEIILREKPPFGIPKYIPTKVFVNGKYAGAIGYKQSLTIFVEEDQVEIRIRRGVLSGSQLLSLDKEKVNVEYSTVGNIFDIIFIFICSFIIFDISLKFIPLPITVHWFLLGGSLLGNIIFSFLNMNRFFRIKKI